MARREHANEMHSVPNRCQTPHVRKCDRKKVTKKVVLTVLDTGDLLVFMNMTCALGCRTIKPMHCKLWSITETYLRMLETL